MADDAHPKPRTHPAPLPARLAVLGLVAVGVGVVFALRLDRYWSFDALREHHAFLVDWTNAHGMAAVALFMTVYAGAVALSIPGVFWLTVLAGALFGWVATTIYVTVAATVGAVGVFLIARYVAGDMARERGGAAARFLSRFEWP